MDGGADMAVPGADARTLVVDEVFPAASAEFADKATGAELAAAACGEKGVKGRLPAPGFGGASGRCL